MAAAEYRAIARDRLTGKWGLAVGTTFVAALLGAVGQGIKLTENFDNDDVQKVLGDNFYYTKSVREVFDASPALSTFFIIAVSILSIWAMVSFILGGPVRLGLCRFNKNLYMNNGNPNAKFNDLFSHFDIFGKGFITNLLMTIFLVLWFCLLFVPGIIMSYAYSMTFYILEEHPELSAMEAIKASKELMRGHKWDYFCLQLSFIGWAILSTLTLGIGGLFLNPYMQQAQYAFYYDITRKAGEGYNGN